MQHLWPSICLFLSMSVFWESWRTCKQQKYVGICEENIYPTVIQTIIFKAQQSPHRQEKCALLSNPWRSYGFIPAAEANNLWIQPWTPCTSPRWCHIVPTCLLVVAKFWSTLSSSASLRSPSKAWSKVLALILGQAKLLSTWEKQQCSSCLSLSSSSSESERGKLRSCLIKKNRKPFVVQSYRQLYIKSESHAH